MSSVVEKTAKVARKLKFGVFEVDLQNRDLRKCGLRLRLQRKPFQILEALLQARGQLVMRNDLAERLWPALHVNFDRSLNTAVNALREALGDSSQNPRFIETRPGLGYRFIAPVEDVGGYAEPAAVKPAAGEAYQDYLKGRYFLNKLTEEDLHKSLAYFESSLALDPECAVAYAGMTDAYCMFAVLNMMPPEQAHARAKDSVSSALRLAPDLGEAHSAAGAVKRLFEWDLAGGRADHLRALDLIPNSATAHQYYGIHLAASARPQEALRELDRAHELDPLSLAINVEIAWCLYVAGDFTRAAEQSWKALAMEPKFAPAQHALALAYEQMGMLEEAVVELRNARACGGDRPAVIAALAHVYASDGKVAEANQMLKMLESMAGQRYVSPYWYAIANAGLKDDQARSYWLTKSRQERDVWYTWLKVDPRFKDPRP